MQCLNRRLEEGASPFDDPPASASHASSELSAEEIVAQTRAAHARLLERARSEGRSLPALGTLLFHPSDAGDCKLSRASAAPRFRYLANSTNYTMYECI